MAGFTTHHLTFITEKTIETKSPKKSEKSFSSEIQMCCSFKKNYSVETQNFYETGRVHTKKSFWAISYGPNEVQYWKGKGYCDSFPAEISKACLPRSRHKCILNLQYNEKKLLVDSIQDLSRSSTVTTWLTHKKKPLCLVHPWISTWFWLFTHHNILRRSPFPSEWIYK